MYTGFLRVIYSTPHGSVILVSLETRLVSYETRLVSRETRGGKLRVSGTVKDPDKKQRSAVTKFIAQNKSR